MSDKEWGEREREGGEMEKGRQSEGDVDTEMGIVTGGGNIKDR